MFRSAYTVWAAAVLVAVGVVQYLGITFADVSESRTNPTSVRANPGAYRSPYFVPGRTLRGK
ncbi:MAG: hypothetical protein KJT01_06770 [Gemmatimonadetes bacterium]|nr:hypothetical protein [Gemmatimonadota bacterium]